MLGSRAEALTGPALRSETVRARDTVYRRLLAAADIVSAALAILLSVQVLGDDLLTPAAIALLPLVAVISKAVGLYDRDSQVMHKTTLDEAPAFVSITALYTLAFWLGEGVFVDGMLGNEQVVGVWCSLLGLMMVARASARELGRLTTSEERLLVVGAPASAGRLSGKLASSHTVGVSPVGTASLAELTMLSRGPGYGLERLLEERDVHRVVIVPDGADPSEVLELVSTLSYFGVKVSVVPRLLEVVGANTHLDEFDDVSLLGVAPVGLTHSSRLLKRSMDAAGAALGLLALAPLLAAIAVAIKLTSPGPALYRQPRIGRAGNRFEILKFRTMRVGADTERDMLGHLNEADGLFKIAEDPRVTHVGRILRRTSLDELPQLWNVLCGQMSLVGPRPLVESEDALVTGTHRRRLEIDPGMTGPWQIRGSSRIPLKDMVVIDYMYVASWSLWKDVKILLRTVTYVARRRGL